MTCLAYGRMGFRAYDDDDELGTTANWALRSPDLNSLEFFLMALIKGHGVQESTTETSWTEAEYSC